MNLKYKNGEEFFFKLNRLFHGYLAMSLLPFGIIYIAKKEGFAIDYPSDIVQWTVHAVIAAVVVYLSFNASMVYKRGYQDFSKEWRIDEKLDFFYRISFRKYSYLCVGTILTVIGYLLDDSYLFVIIYVGLLFIMSLGRPTERNIERELGLSNEEKEMFRNKEGFMLKKDSLSED